MADFKCIIWKVEHGSAAFLITPNHRTIMFDAGSSEDFSPAVHLSEKYNLNNQGNRLDRLILSHPDRDHISDLPNTNRLLNPKRFTRNHNIPERVIYPSGKSNLQDPLKTYNEMTKIYVHPINNYNKATPITNWGDVFVKTFCCNENQVSDCPDSHLKNNMSIVSYIRYKDTEIVIPGDLEPYGWWALLENTEISKYIGNAKARILVASHHGRESGLCYYDDADKRCIYSDFLDIMKPHLVIMSDKRGNETTVPELYKPHASGFPVHSKSDHNIKKKQVLTTKTNNYVLINVYGEHTTPAVVTP